MKKKILSMLLAICLVIGLVPIASFASENEQTGNIIFCEHHTAHTTECGYKAAIEGHECMHEHDDECGYTEEQTCTHEHDDACGYIEASEGSPCTFVCDICEDEEDIRENNLSQAVLAVQDLIDTIPEAEDITEDNFEDIADLLGEIDTLKAELTDEESELLDYTKYDEAVAKMMELTEQAGAEKPAVMASCTCLIKCTATNNDCPVCKSGTANCTGRPKFVDYEGESIVNAEGLHVIMSWPASQRDYYYFSLDNYVRNDNDDLTVLAAVPADADIVIDLNGNILNGNGKGTIFEVAGKLTIIDTKGGGKITKASNGTFHILEGGYVLMQGGTIENCTGTGAVIVESGGKFEMTGGTIKNNEIASSLIGFAKNITVRGTGIVTVGGDAQVLCCDVDGCSCSGYHIYLNKNYGSGGAELIPILYANSGKIKGTIINEGKIAFRGVNYGSGASIDGYVNNFGTIDGSRLTFYSGVTNNGTIKNGIFQFDITNNGIITGGRFRSSVTNNGTISGGTFDLGVTNNGTISGGTFEFAVTNNENGLISGGRFLEKVTNNGTISDGEFLSSVTNNSTISDGDFRSSVTNNGTISGGEFYKDVNNSGTISGGTFLGTVDTTNGTVADSLKVTVYFVTDTDTEITTMKVLRGQGISSSDLPMVDDPTIYGYNSFDGWRNGDADYSGGGQFIDDENYIYAKFSDPTSYTIDYVLQNGMADNPLSYTIETETFTLKNPTKDGYDFAGWSGTDLVGSDNMTVTIEKGSTGYRRYVANYTKKSYTIAFDTNGADYIAPITDLRWNSLLLDVLPENPTYAGLTFIGWKYNGMAIGGETTYGDLAADETVSKITLTAQWSNGTPLKEPVLWDYDTQTYTYDGTGKAFEVRGTTLDGFQVIYEQNGNAVANPTNAGSYNVTVIRPSDENYRAVNTTISNGLVIEPKAVTARIDDIPDKTYTGKDIKPAITVYDGATVIPSGEYTVSYTDNKNAGTATVIVTDKEGGNYIVSGSKTFTIKPKSVTASISSIPAQTYTGSNIEPAVTVYGGATEISANEYTVSYADNRDVGIATVTVTDKEGGNYVVNAGGSAIFIIKPKTVTATISSIPAQTYTGNDIEPAITVYDGATQIPADEYTISYTNNRNAGTATVTLTDNEGGNYIVSGSTTFNIKPKTVTASISSIPDETYTGNDIEPAITVYDGATQIPASEYTVNYSNNRNAGTATVIITDNEGGNYTVSGSTTFAIKPKSIADAVITLGEALTYNGTEQTQNVIVTLDGFDTVTFDVSGNKQTDVQPEDNYTLTITGNGNFEGTKTLDWNIAPATPAENSAKKTTARVRKNKALANASVTEGEICGLDGVTPLTGTFAWVDGTKVMSADGTEQMTFTPADLNYAPITIDVAVDVYSPISSGDSSSGDDSNTSSAKPTETSVVGTIDNAADTSVKTETTTETTNKAAADAAKNDATVNLVTAIGTTVSGDDFKEPVILHIPADTNGVKNVNNLTLAKFNAETGKLEIVGGSYDAETKMVAGYIDKAGDYFVVEMDGLITITLQIDNIDVTLNNTNKALDAAPIISQDRTMVPIRFIAEALGAQVGWDEKTKSVSIVKDGKTLLMQIDKEIEGFGAAPIISNNRTMVPIRYISEQLGANVLWIPSTQTISIVGFNTNSRFLD